MSRASKTAVSAIRPRKRQRKARFAPIRLDGAAAAPHIPAPLGTAFEVLFPDGLILRVARDADPVTLEQFFRRLRRRMD